MEKEFTPSARNLISFFVVFLVFMFTSITTHAQVTCPNSTVLWTDNFGQGTTPTSDSNIIATNLYYQGNGLLYSEAAYRIVDSTFQQPFWHHSGDHTGNLDGKMLVANGNTGSFYQNQFTTTGGFAAGTYIAGLYLMNVDTLGVCGPHALLPAISFTVEYLSAANTWVSLSGSPYIAQQLPQTATPTWVNLGSSFILPSTGTFSVAEIRITLSDTSSKGCGNDYALDDISFSLCPSGGPTPVTFLNINAHQMGTGVSIDWSTAQEINSNYFEVQKSADGSSNWETVSTVTAAGNSQVVRNYNAFDGSPFSGSTFYRIAEVDKDGNFSYSKIVNVQTNLGSTGVSVLTNPFHNSLTVNFSSTTSQDVSARLIDMTGRQVTIEKWSISAGSTQMSFSNVSNLQSGIYILSVINNSGEILFNTKVVKQ